LSQDLEARLTDAVRTRRTFAIISHPDAGKTTLTEKLLLYGGAIHLAGSVKSRRAARHAASDWMKLEQERGISVTSSVMQFQYDGYHINLLDTPGHEDFSEDTYRTLVAADSAVMLLDNRKGVEDRTRQLFSVCKRRRTPIFTFVNKCDRVGVDPLALIGDVESDLGIACHPVTWPIFNDAAFAGVFDRRRRVVFLFDRGEDHGATRAEAQAIDPHDQKLRDLIGAESHERLLADLALLDEAGHPFDHEAVLEGELSPVFFGSARRTVPQGIPRARAIAALARIDGGRRRADRRALYRIRVQDPGEHGRTASRPRRLRPCVLGPLRGGNAGQAGAHRQAAAPPVAAAIPGA